MVESNIGTIHFDSEDYSNKNNYSQSISDKTTPTSSTAN